MPADYTNLQVAVAAAAKEANDTIGTEDSAGVIIAAIGTAVTAAVAKALTADNAADQTSIDAATKAISDTIAVFTGGRAKLGAAIAANPGTP